MRSFVAIEFLYYSNKTLSVSFNPSYDKQVNKSGKQFSLQ